MATVNTTSTHFKKLIADLIAARSYKVILMRDGFTFDRDVHKKLANIRTNTTAIALTWAASDSSVSRGSGSFVTDGFVAGNKCTSDDSSNPGPFTILTVTALKITFNEAVVNSTATKTLSSDDELATANGYTQYSKGTGTLTAVENPSTHVGQVTFPTIPWTATGGQIGPTPGVMFIDDTSSDKTIASYIEFDSPKTVTDGESMNLNSGSFEVS